MLINAKPETDGASVSEVGKQGEEPGKKERKKPGKSEGKKRRKAQTIIS